MAFLPFPIRDVGDRVAVDDHLGTLSYRDLLAASAGATPRLRAAGVRPGTVVAVLGTLDRSLVASLHAVWRAGGAVAPVHPGWTAEEVRRALAGVEPGLTLLGAGVPPETVAAVESAGTGVQALTDLFRGPGELSEEAWGPGVETPAESTDLSALAARLFTSGTAGQPKVVDLTVRNLRASAEASRRRLELQGTDRWFASLSVAHVGGLAMVTRAGLLGCRLVLDGPFDAPRLAALIGDGRVTHASLVPTMLHRLLGAWGSAPTPDTLRCLLVGGAGTPSDLLTEALDRGFPVALTYGLSEASSQVATAAPDLVARKPGTVGPPLPDTELRIGPEGGIQVRGGIVSPGHADSQGWLHTGDLGRLDEDGHLWVTGRSADRILSGGLTVDPGEVEAVLTRHPSVRDAVVCGIDDPEWGERIVAAVVPSAESPDLLETLDALVRAHLSPGKRPRQVRIVHDIPVNPNGKVDRDRVRSWFQ